MRSASPIRVGSISVAILLSIVAVGGAGALALFQRGGEAKVKTPLFAGEIHIPGPLSADGRNHSVNGNEPAKTETPATSRRGTCGDADQPVAPLADVKPANGLPQPAAMPAPLSKADLMPSGTQPNPTPAPLSKADLWEGLERLWREKIQPLEDRQRKLEDDVRKNREADLETLRKLVEAQSRQNMELVAELQALRDQLGRVIADGKRDTDALRAEIARMREQRDTELEAACETADASRKAVDRLQKELDELKMQKPDSPRPSQPEPPPVRWNTRVAVGDAPCGFRFQYELSESGAEQALSCPKCRQVFLAKLTATPGGWATTTRPAPPK